MKKLFRHIVQTIFLVAAACVVACLPTDPMASYMPGLVWSLIIAAIGLLGVVLYQQRRRGLLIVGLIIVGVFLMTQPVWAQGFWDRQAGVAEIVRQNNTNAINLMSRQTDMILKNVEAGKAQDEISWLNGELADLADERKGLIAQRDQLQRSGADKKELENLNNEIGSLDDSIATYTSVRDLYQKSQTMPLNQFKDYMAGREYDRITQELTRQGNDPSSVAGMNSYENLNNLRSEAHQVTTGGDPTLVLRGEDQHIAQCYQQTGEDMYNCLLAYYGQLDFCRIESEFKASAAIKQNRSPNRDAVKVARKFIDTYDRAYRAGYVSKHGWFTEGVSFGGFSNDMEDNRDCAEDFLDEVATYYTKKQEKAMEMVYPLLVAERDKCWPCDIVNIVMTVTENIATSLDSTLRHGAIILLGVMLLFWILIKVLIMILKMGTAKNSEFFSEGLRIILMSICAVALLNVPLTEIYKYTLSPVVSVVSGINSELMTIHPENALGTKLVGEQVLRCDCCTEGANANCSGGVLTNTTMDSGIFDAETKRELLCMSCNIYKQTAPMITAGRVLVHYSYHERKWWSKATRALSAVATGGLALLVPVPMTTFLIGLALIVCFGWISFSICFRIMDVFLRLGFAILVTPFLITAYVFPVSRGYVKNGWNIFANALVNLLGISLAVVFIMAVFEASMPDSSVTELHRLMTMQGTMPNDYAKNLAAALGGGDKGTLFTIFFFVMLCFFGLSVIKAAQKVVEGLFDVACGFPAIAGAAVMGAVGVAKSVAHLGTAIIQDRLDKLKKSQGGQEKAQKAEKDEQGGISKVSGRAAAGMRKMGDAGGEATEKAISSAGTATQAGGRSMMSAGVGMSSTGIGAVVGVPLIIAGAAVTAAGVGLKAVAKPAGKAVKYSARAAAKVVEKTGKAAQRVWNRTKRAIKNRMRQVKAAAKKPIQAIRRLPRKLSKKSLKVLRRRRASGKYRRRRR